jgi:hypothetical protein
VEVASNEQQLYLDGKVFDGRPAIGRSKVVSDHELTALSFVRG